MPMILTIFWFIPDDDFFYFCLKDEDIFSAELKYRRIFKAEWEILPVLYTYKKVQKLGEV
jgi:hypothetical protein